MSDKKNEHDYLMEHLSKVDQRANHTQQNTTTKVEGAKIGDLNYFAFEPKFFPCGEFYPDGMVVRIRACNTAEIQAFSMVSETDNLDVISKMNYILESCVKVEMNDGTPASYLDIKDQDRYYIIFLIRQLTFQNGTNLAMDEKCSCGNIVHVDWVKENFERFEIPSRLQEFYNPSDKKFHFTMYDNTVIKLGLPSIGLQKAFSKYIIAEHQNLNLSFLKNSPYIMSDLNDMSLEDLRTASEEYGKMSMDKFAVLDEITSMLNFGIKKVSKVCECGNKVSLDFRFPSGIKGIFSIPNAFESFIKK